MQHQLSVRFELPSSFISRIDFDSSCFTLGYKIKSKLNSELMIIITKKNRFDVGYNGRAVILVRGLKCDVETKD